MGNPFKSPPPVVVSTPFQQTSSGSSEIKPYVPVEPFIEQLLPEVRETFTQAPELFTGCWCRKTLPKRWQLGTFMDR